MVSLETIYKTLDSYLSTGIQFPKEKISKRLPLLPISHPLYYTGH